MRLILTAFLLISGSFAAPTPEIIIVSPHWEGIRYETARAFSDWHQQHYGTPVDVRWRSIGGGTSQIVKYLSSEFAHHPEGIGIDLFFGGGIDPYLDLKAAGFLEKYELPQSIRSQIPPQLGGFDLYDPDQQWFGASLSSFGILGNHRIIRLLHLPSAQTWEDLADPRLTGWISSGDPRQSGSILTMYEIILQAYGWEKGWQIITGISANVRSFLKSGAASAREAALGESAYALAIDIYALAEVAYVGKEDLSFVLPTGVTAINPDSMALIKKGPNPVYARHFIDFILSTEGQKLWMLPKGAPGGATRFDINRMCILPSLYQELQAVSPVEQNPFTMSLTFHYSSKTGAKQRSILAGFLGAVFIDLQPELIRAWKAIQQSPRRERLLQELNQPYFSEKEFDKMGATTWKDPLQRNLLINHWQSEASARYRQLEKSAL